MFSAQFIFQPGTYDEEFHRLDKSIDEYALTLPGFKGVERWVSPDGKTKNSIYYFTNRETIAKFARYPDHYAAKKQVARWYNAYQVVISEIVASYGDGKISTLANS